MTPERLQQIKERYADECTRRDHVAELIDTVDHLTADNARLRAGIADATQALWEAWVEGGDTDLIDQASDDLKALLNPTEGGSDA